MPRAAAKASTAAAGAGLLFQSVTKFAAAHNAKSSPAAVSGSKRPRPAAAPKPRAAEPDEDEGDEEAVPAGAAARPAVAAPAAPARRLSIGPSGPPAKRLKIAEGVAVRGGTSVAAADKGDEEEDVDLRRTSSTAVADDEADADMRRPASRGRGKASAASSRATSRSNSIDSIDGRATGNDRPRASSGAAAKPKRRSMARRSELDDAASSSRGVADRVPESAAPAAAAATAPQAPTLSSALSGAAGGGSTAPVPAVSQYSVGVGGAISAAPVSAASAGVGRGFMGVAGGPLQAAAMPAAAVSYPSAAARSYRRGAGAIDVAPAARPPAAVPPPAPPAAATIQAASAPPAAPPRVPPVGMRAQPAAAPAAPPVIAAASDASAVTSLDNVQAAGGIRHRKRSGSRADRRRPSERETLPDAEEAPAITAAQQPPAPAAVRAAAAAPAVAAPAAATSSWLSAAALVPWAKTCILALLFASAAALLAIGITYIASELVAQHEPGRIVLEEAASVLLHARGDALCEGLDAGDVLPPASHASGELSFPPEAVYTPTAAGAAGAAAGGDGHGDAGLFATARRVLDAVRMRDLAPGIVDGALEASRSDAFLAQNPLYTVAVDDNAVDEAIGDPHSAPRCAYRGWVSRGCLYRALAPLLKLNHPSVFGNASSRAVHAYPELFAVAWYKLATNASMSEFEGAVILPGAASGSVPVAVDAAAVVDGATTSTALAAMPPPASPVEYLRPTEYHAQQGKSLACSLREQCVAGASHLLSAAYWVGTWAWRLLWWILQTLLAIAVAFPLPTFLLVLGGSIAAYLMQTRRQRAMVAAMHEEVFRLLGNRQLQQEYPNGMPEKDLLTAVLGSLYSASMWDAAAATRVWPQVLLGLASDGRVKVVTAEAADKPNTFFKVLVLSPIGKMIAARTQAAREGIASPDPQPQHVQQQLQPTGVVPAGFVPVQQMPVLVPGYAPTGHPLEYAAGPAVQAQQQQPQPYAAPVRRIHF